MQKKIFFLNAVSLTAATLIVKLMGISFRVYMSNKIGPQGIGLYQLITIIYFFLATVVTSGINLVVTRLITDTLACNNFKKVKKIMRVCIVITVCFGVIFGGVLFFGAKFIGENILKDSRAILSLKILAPSLLFMGLSSCFRGYFIAIRRAAYTALEQVIEQVIEIATFALLIILMPTCSVEFACAYVVIGTTLAEIISFFYTYFLYTYELKKLAKKYVNNKNQPNNFFKKFISIWFPTTGNACLRSGLSMVENISIPKNLKKSGASYNGSLCAYGIISGMVMPVVTFPCAFLVSFSELLIPEFSEANAKNNKLIIQNLTHKAFEISFYFSILVSSLFAIYGKDLGLLLYNNECVGFYIALLAPVLPLTYLDSVVDAILKGLNQQLCYFTYNLIDSIMRIVLIFVLVPKMGITGIIVIIFISEILNSTLSILKLLKITELRLELLKWIVKPIFCMFIASIFFILFNNLLSLVLTNKAFLLIFKMLATSVIYLALLILTNCIKINLPIEKQQKFNF